MKTFNCAIVSAVCLFLTSPLPALTVEIVDQNGVPLNNAVVAVSSLDSDSTRQPDKTNSVVDQVNKRFLPEVSVIQTGTEVNFPNSDNIRHHVYSFSKTRPFELPLYGGESSFPVNFESTGKVVIGCNIHDTMSGIIYVLDTNTFSKTDNGKVEFSDLASGNYRIDVYHQHASIDPADSTEVHVDNGAAKTIKLTLNVQAKATQESGLSELQKKFKSLRRD